jgi:hypothetical protein
LNHANSYCVLLPFSFWVASAPMGGRRGGTVRLSGLGAADLTSQTDTGEQICPRNRSPESACSMPYPIPRPRHWLGSGSAGASSSLIGRGCWFGCARSFCFVRLPSRSVSVSAFIFSDSCVGVALCHDPGGTRNALCKASWALAPWCITPTDL